MLKTIFLASRPNFLLLTPICIFLGLASVHSVGGDIHFVLALWVFIGALCAHIAVNLLNEYSDFKSGLDFITKRTDFSGGSGALIANPSAKQGVLIAGIASLLITISIGAYLLSVVGMPLLLIGVLGVILVVLYTQWLNRMPWLCLIAPGLGFGLLMIVGTSVVMLGSYTWQALLLASVPFFLVNNLLLLNQYPDIDADKQVGRKHFPIYYGIEKSNAIYLMMLILANVLIVVQVWFEFIPVIALVAIAPMFLGLFAYKGMCKEKKNISNNPQYLAANVACTLLTPFILAVTVVI